MTSPETYSIHVKHVDAILWCSSKLNLLKHNTIQTKPPMSQCHVVFLLHWYLFPLFHWTKEGMQWNQPLATCWQMSSEVCQVISKNRVISSFGWSFGHPSTLLAGTFLSKFGPELSCLHWESARFAARASGNALEKGYKSQLPKERLNWKSSTCHHFVQLWLLLSGPHERRGSERSSKQALTKYFWMGSGRWKCQKQNNCRESDLTRTGSNNTTWYNMRGFVHPPFYDLSIFACWKGLGAGSLWPKDAKVIAQWPKSILWYILSFGAVIWPISGSKKQVKRWRHVTSKLLKIHQHDGTMFCFSAMAGTFWSDPAAGGPYLTAMVRCKGTNEILVT